jgi:hypothetical protein
MYLVMLSDLSIGASWTSHIISLVENGKDLKYEYIRSVVRESGLQKGDPPQVGIKKLARFRSVVVREALLTLKTEVERQNAMVIVVLVPAAENSYVSAARFRGVRQLVESTGIRVIDLLNTFEGADVEAMRIQWYDPHWNTIGNRMIASNLYQQMRKEPDALSALYNLSRTPCIGPKVRSSQR